MTSKDGKKLAFEMLLNDAELRAHRAALQAEPRADRHRHERAHRRHRAVSSAATDDFDFDMMIDGFGQSLSPGNEQRDFWGSKAADTPGSRNTIGIKDPAIDELIEQADRRARPREPDHRHPRARPGAAVEPLRRARTGTTTRPASPTGTASRGPPRARGTAPRRARHLVGRRREGQGPAAAPTRSSAAAAADVRLHPSPPDADGADPARHHGAQLLHRPGRARRAGRADDRRRSRARRAMRPSASRAASATASSRARPTRRAAAPAPIAARAACPGS